MDYPGNLAKGLAFWSWRSALCWRLWPGTTGCRRHLLENALLGALQENKTIKLDRPSQTVREEEGPELPGMERGGKVEKDGGGFRDAGSVRGRDSRSGELLSVMG